MSVSYHKATSIFGGQGKIMGVCGVEMRTKESRTSLAGQDDTWKAAGSYIK